MPPIVIITSKKVVRPAVKETIHNRAFYAHSEGAASASDRAREQNVWSSEGSHGSPIPGPLIKHL